MHCIDVDFHIKNAQLIKFLMPTNRARTIVIVTSRHLLNSEPTDPLWFQCLSLDVKSVISLFGTKGDKSVLCYRKVWKAKIFSRFLYLSHWAKLTRLSNKLAIWWFVTCQHIFDIGWLIFAIVDTVSHYNIKTSIWGIVMNFSFKYHKSKSVFGNLVLGTSVLGTWVFGYSWWFISWYFVSWYFGTAIVFWVLVAVLFLSDS